MDKMPQAGKAPPNQKEQCLNRKERIILSQLRAGGHCPILRSYQKRVNKRDDAICECGKEDNLEHLFKDCPIYENKRYELFGPNPTVDLLWSNPKDVVDYLRVSGRLNVQATTA